MAIHWKQDKVLSIETRTGLFVLAQMLEEPYLVFYNAFQKTQNWGKTDLSKTPILFCTAVAREFLNSSNILVQKTINGVHCDRINKYWIHISSIYRTIRLWEGTESEIEFLTMGHGGRLIEEDPYCQKACGEKETVIQNEIDFNDSETIDTYDLDQILFYPCLNERLYLCYKFTKSIDPLKDFVFDRDIPLEYEVYIKLYANKMTEEEWQKLSC